MVRKKSFIISLVTLLFFCLSNLSLHASESSSELLERGYESLDNAGMANRERIEEVEIYLGKLRPAFKTVQDKIHSLDTRLDSIEEVFSKVDIEQFEQLNEILENLQDEVSNLVEVQQQLSVEVDNIKEDVDEIKGQDFETIQSQLHHVRRNLYYIQETIEEISGSGQIP